MDTRNKRASAISTARSWLPLFPDPDGTLDQGDRQQTAWAYVGILAGTVTPPVITADMIYINMPSTPARQTIAMPSALAGQTVAMPATPARIVVIT